MRRLKFFLAFGFGCSAAMMFGYGADMTWQLSGPSAAEAGKTTLESRLNSLEAHAADLEQRAAAAQRISSKVVAPFDVTDGKKRIFIVNPDYVGLFFGNKEGASMSAGTGGGNFVAYSTSGGLQTTLGKKGDVWGISVSENFVDRIALGSDAKAGTHHLTFYSSAKQEIAGIGESADTHAALVLVFDKAGNLRGRLAVSTDGKGIADVLGANKVPLAQMTESESGGGRLVISNAGGIGMVEAGDAGGYGIVRVGPEGFKFIPTPGLALPGNVIVGKQ